MILISLTAVAFLTAAAAGLIAGVLLSLRLLSRTLDDIEFGNSDDWYS